MRNRLLIVTLIVVLLGVVTVPSCTSTTTKAPPYIQQYSVDRVLYIASTTAPPCLSSLAVDRYFEAIYIGQGVWEIAMKCHNERGTVIEIINGSFDEASGEVDWNRDDPQYPIITKPPPIIK